VHTFGALEVLAKICGKVFFTLFFSLLHLPAVLQRDQAFSLSCTEKIA
jgi:hypothetical protein